MCRLAWGAPTDANCGVRASEGEGRGELEGTSSSIPMMAPTPATQCWTCRKHALHAGAAPSPHRFRLSLTRLGNPGFLILFRVPLSGLNRGQ